MNGRIAALSGRVSELTAAQLDGMDDATLASLYASGARLLKVKNNDTITLHTIDSSGALTWLGSDMPTDNLLDNPEFAIAQAGYGGNHGTQAYAADRWKLVSGSVSYAENAGLTLNGTITQKLEKIPTGPVSAFVGMSSGVANISYADGIVTITSSGGVLAWAALYAGTYTSTTRPVFRHKGYVEELEKCQLYYRRISVTLETMQLMGYVSGGSSSAAVLAYNTLPMRTNRPTVHFSGGISIRGVDGYADDASIESPYQNPNVRLYGGDVSTCFPMIVFEKQDKTAWGLLNNTVISLVLNRGSLLEFVGDP